MDNTVKESKMQLMDKRVIISTLWIVIMFNMVFADILGFMIPGTLADIMTGYGGSAELEYYFFAGIESVCMLAIIYIIAKWKE